VVTLSAGTLAGLAVTVTVLAAALCWLMVVVAELPVPGAPACSVPVMVQKPTTVDALYVMVALPVASVALGLAVVKTPQVPLELNVIESAATAAPVTPLVTVAVTVEVLEPSAARVEGEALNVMLFRTAV
jgi:hypothetical protein